MAIEFSRVAMKDVPDPPSGRRPSPYYPLFKAVKELPRGESHAIRVQVAGGAKKLIYMRQQLGKMGQRDGIRILSSRNLESTLAWFWWIDGECE